MTGSRVFFLVLLALGCAPSAVGTQYADQAVALTPREEIAGSPELIRVIAPEAKSIEGEWLGRRIQFFPSAERGTWVALAGADV